MIRKLILYVIILVIFIENTPIGYALCPISLNNCTSIYSMFYDALYGKDVVACTWREITCIHITKQNFQRYETSLFKLADDIGKEQSHRLIDVLKQYNTKHNELSLFVVAKINNKVIGCAVCFNWGKDSTRLFAIGVTPKLRERGIGTLLLWLVAKTAQAKAHSTIRVVECVSETIDFLESYGFTVFDLGDYANEYQAESSVVLQKTENRILQTNDHLQLISTTAEQAPSPLVTTPASSL